MIYNEEIGGVLDVAGSVELQQASLSAMTGLTPCAAEAICMPGSVQPHGFLLGLDAKLQTVSFASENAEVFLGVPLKLLLGASVDLFLEVELLASVYSLAEISDPEGLLRYLGAFHIRGELCSVVTHRNGMYQMLEFERQDRLVGPEMMNAVITNFVGTLSNLKTKSELCQAIAKQVRDLTGFDRVLLYHFDAAGHGTVLAEEKNDFFPNLLGLRFPADDIPPQARALYVLNTLRIIPDVFYKPVPIRGLPGGDAQTLDMSFCVLRSVSPFHLEYMRNMGTMSSMSISIVCEGRLWGLISGHHRQPLLVPYLVRSACDMLTKMVGTQLTAIQTASELQVKLGLNEVQRSMLTQIASENDYTSVLASNMETLMEVTAATGVVLSVDGHKTCFGLTPDAERVRELIDWLAEQPGLELFQTQQLSSVLPWASDLTGIASGLLAIRISSVQRRYILWFRPEIVRTVHWAGQPVKPLDEEDRPHPRKSFEAWKQTVHAQSLAWSSMEVASARDFRAALTTISLRRVEEEAAISEARFSQLTHALPMKIFAVTDDGQLTFVNDHWREQGHPESGLWFEAAGLNPEDVKRCSDSWDMSVAREEEFEEEVLISTVATGLACWNLIRIVSFRREGSERSGWIGICMDLTERKAREIALRVTEKLTLTGRMTSFLGHEINNPLESITNILYLAKQTLPPGAAAANYLAMVDEELERITGIVKQTVRWSAQNSPEKSWVTAGSLFEDVLRLFSAKIRNRNVQVTVVRGKDLLVCGIVGQLRQIVAHLLSNAIDAVPVGGRVWLQAESIQGEIEILVGDNGTGMNEVELESLFQPFYSTKGDLGNGLGLYLSGEIAERHKGRFLIQSAVGHGTTARLRLPLELMDSPELPNLPTLLIS